MGDGQLRGGQQSPVGQGGCLRGLGSQEEVSRGHQGPSSWAHALLQQ